MGKETDYTPVWFMRQAGRYLPIYRKIKGEKDVIELSKDPFAASEVVLTAVRELGVDAGVIFSDIMVPLSGIGVLFSLKEDIGPVVKNPIRKLDDVESLRDFDPETELDYVLKGIDLSVQKLNGLPLIGFSGAPFTLATYMIEGSHSRNFRMTKRLMYGQPDIWKALMEKLTKLVIRYLRAQVKHGVNAIQLFDTWVGNLSRHDYEKYVQGYTLRVFESLGNIPKIHFALESCQLIGAIQRTGANVLSIDWRIPIDEAWRMAGGQLAIQGNLDPVLAVVGGRAMEHAVLDILKRSEDIKGYIFNLGHGVLKETSPSNLKRIVNMVHKITRKKR